MMVSARACEDAGAVDPTQTSGIDRMCPDAAICGRMNEHKPAPPKACPVCQVAMQATRVGEDTEHRCERCALTIRVTASGHGEKRRVWTS
jgi:hypothetical protein